MEKFFKTFDGRDDSELNDKIRDFTELEECIELSRSQPALCYQCDGFYKIAVTSEFRKMNDIEKIKHHEALLEKAKHDGDA